jgi:acetyltransferase-like isoleucine patch superfamily enzyme
LSFLEELDRFIAEGNTVIGRPHRVSRRARFHWSGSNSRIVFGNKCKLREIELHLTEGGANLAFGDETVIRATIVVGTGSSLVIGNRTRFNARSFLSAREAKSISIGEDCLFAISIRTSDMHAIFDAETGQRLNHGGDVTIADRVWLAEHVSIYKGVTIGSDCVIGAHSVVTRDIPPGCLAVGSPASVSRQNIVWTRKITPIFEKSDMTVESDSEMPE